MFHSNTLFSSKMFEHVAGTNIVQLDFILVIFIMIDFGTSTDYTRFQGHRSVFRIVF